MARRRHKRKHNPSHKRRRGRRLRHNPDTKPQAKPRAKRQTKALTVGTLYGPTEQMIAEQLVAARAAEEPRRRRGPRRKLSPSQRKFRSKLLSRAKRMRTAAKKLPKGLKRSAKYAQARRISVLARLAPRKPKKSPLAKALHIKTNPGFAGLVSAAKVVLPQVGASAASMAGCSMVGRKVSDMITKDSEGASREFFKDKPALEAYMPAVTTAATSAAAYVLADRFAPRYKFAIGIGGMIAAALQALSAAASRTDDEKSWLKKAANVFGPALPAAPAGEYTLVGGRQYAESGIFRNMGEYTTVGDAYSLARPRNTLDNRMELVAGLGDPYSLARPRNTLDNRMELVAGMDDATEFAPGEGGILSGGIFRGPSTR